MPVHTSIAGSVTATECVGRIAGIVGLAKVANPVICLAMVPMIKDRYRPLTVIRQRPCYAVRVDNRAEHTDTEIAGSGVNPACHATSGNDPAPALAVYTPCNDARFGVIGKHAAYASIST